MPIKHRTLDAFVVDELRERIVSGALEAGTKIDQQALAEELGVSRMPVREALRRLSAEGFVELLSHRGAVVVQLSVEEIIEIYEMRGVLQGLAARLAVPNYTDEDIAEIKRLLDEMDATQDVQAWITLNGEFHRHIEGPANAKRLDELIERLTLQCAPYLQISVHFLHAQSSPQELHHEIYKAVESRDAEALEAAVRAHLSSWGGDVAGFVRDRAAADADGSERAVA
jgi:DNA-binding GntR family transcriptional regulator